MAHKPETAIYTAYDDFKHIDHALPERNLMRAMLTLAMDDVRAGGDRARDAIRYVLDERDDYLYSFISICNHLGLCPRTIRTVVGLVPPGMARRSMVETAPVEILSEDELAMQPDAGDGADSQ